MAISIDGTQVASSAAQLDQKIITLPITLGTSATAYAVVPWGCKLVAAYSVIDAALSIADETVALKNHAGSAMTGGTITITQVGSAAGDIDSVTPSANNSFASGEMIQIAIGGENGTAVTASLSLVFQVT
ncbi:MAG: hypothetical protein IIA59_12140 [Candidatus Marinimicrobia bacterium]|nr:hypothetical protein [Candidatus Neomarinimicrobiota bacterium]